MDDEPARRFEGERGRLTAVAHRVLGDHGEAEDVVRECRLRLGRVDAAGIDDLPGWLTTVTVRLCLHSLRRGARDSGANPEADLEADPGADPGATERVALVLHDLCGTPYDEVAAALGRSTVATRQLASRARRRLQAPGRTLAAERTVHARVVEAFLAASRDGDLEELVWLLHPDAELHADAATVARGAEALVRGADAVAVAFAGSARATRPALLDGFAAAVRSVLGAPPVVIGFTVVDGRVAGVELLSDPDVLALLDLAT